MKVCVIGGANVDITATSGAAFRIGDSNPGTVRVSWGGVARNIAHNLSLLGDQVELLTIFGGGPFARLIKASCEQIGISTANCEIAPGGTNSFFVSINNADGELVGGVADMNATEGLKVFSQGSQYEFPALPCKVRSVTGGGDALLAGIVHAGANASVERAAKAGLECARLAAKTAALLRS